jgi:hypothetical protein
MTDRRVLNLLYVVLILVVVNLGATFYFQMARTTASAATSEGSNQALISSKEATDYARTVVDLYNANDVHGLYLKFDDMARLKITEGDLREKLSKLQSMLGHVQDIAYSNATVAGKEGDLTYLVLNYKARLAGGTFNTGSVKLTVAMKDGHPSLFGFYVTGQAE